MSGQPKGKLAKRDVEILCHIITQHVELNLDRRLNELKAIELSLGAQASKGSVGLGEVREQAKPMVDIVRFVRCAKLTMAYLERVKNASLLISDSCNAKNTALLKPLLPYFEGIVWSSTRLNISAVKDFSKFLERNFGSQCLKNAEKAGFVLEEMTSIFPHVEPTFEEMDEFIAKFLQRHKSPIQFEPMATPPQQEPSIPPLQQLGSQIICKEWANASEEINRSFEVLLPKPQTQQEEEEEEEEYIPIADPGYLLTSSLVQTNFGPSDPLRNGRF